MKRTSTRKRPQEPIGIVISSGWRTEEPVDSLPPWIYGDAPDTAPPEADLTPVAG